MTSKVKLLGLCRSLRISFIVMTLMTTLFNPAYALIASTPASSSNLTSFPVQMGNASLWTTRHCYMLKLSDSVDKNITSSVSSLLVNMGLLVEKEFEFAFKGFHLCLPDGMNELPLTLLQEIPWIEFIEREQKVTLEQTQAPIREQPGASWALRRSSQKPSLQTQDNGNYEFALTGRGVNIYILDSGINSLHREFGNRAQTVYSPVQDGLPLESNDCTGHGTHVAGLAAGTDTGVAKLANILMVRAFSCSEDTDLNLFVQGLDWVIQDYQKRRVPSVLSLSIGGAASDSVDSAVKNVLDQGIPVVVAAGNQYTDACQISPARVSGVITVGAVTEDDRLAYFSNYGTCVDIFAPGMNILSARNITDEYAYRNGTSMSAPLVAGAVALILEARPTSTIQDIFQILYNYATDNVLNQATLLNSHNALLQTLGFENIMASGQSGSANSVQFLGNVPGDLPFVPTTSTKATSTSGVSGLTGNSKIVLIVCSCAAAVALGVICVTQYRVRRARQQARRGF